MDYSLLIGLHTLPDHQQQDNNFPNNEYPFLFYKDFNGFRSSFDDNSDGPEVYYLGR